MSREPARSEQHGVGGVAARHDSASPGKRTLTSGRRDVENLASNLTAPKDIQVALPQTYEAQPGTALARFMVTRVRKTDGSWKVKKAPR